MSSGKKSRLSSIAARAQDNLDQIRQGEIERRPSRLVSVDKIQPGVSQARRDFSNLTPLVEDIQKNGVLQPILLRPIGAERYEIVAGERRWRASKEAGRSVIPAVIREMSDHEAAILGLAENLQREDLNAYEIAQAVVELAAIEMSSTAQEIQDGLSVKRTNEDLSRAMDEALSFLGREITLRTFQRHYLPLLRLPSHLIEAIEEGASYLSVLKLRTATEEQQHEFLPKVISGEWSTRQLEQALREARTQSASTTPKQEEYDWSSRVQSVRKILDVKRLRQLDKGDQRKAQRLLEQLEVLIEGTQKQE